MIPKLYFCDGECFGIIRHPGDQIFKEEQEFLQISVRVRDGSTSMRKAAREASVGTVEPLLRCTMEFEQLLKSFSNLASSWRAEIPMWSRAPSGARVSASFAQFH